MMVVVVVVVVVMLVMVMIVAIVVVVVVVMMVVLGKFHVRTLDLWIDQFRRGLSDVRGHQERKRIGDGIKELGIGPRRREFTRVGKCLCGGLGAVERRQSRDHANYANNLLVHGLLLGVPDASARGRESANVLSLQTEEATHAGDGSSRCDPRVRRMVPLAYHNAVRVTADVSTAA
jgi:hypothetical protein